MTALHVMWLASIAGALLFFAAGAASSALRRRAAPASAAPRASDDDHLLREARGEIHRMKLALGALESARASAEAARVSAEAKAHTAATSGRRDEATARELERMKVALGAAEAARVASEAARVSAEALAREAQRRTEATAREAKSSLENARVQAVGVTRELEQAKARVIELEGQLAAKTESLRTLSTENEHMKGRLRDAEALRAEYVRLRTSTTDAEYLKSEIARLQEELVATRAAALGAVRPRPRSAARGTDRPATMPTGSIGESLTTVLERFSDAGTRSIAIGDRQGFVVASNGDDGTALAAHAAQLAEAASRAKSFLPFGTPASIEVMDEHGARVSVWTFPADGEPLLLASLAVSAPEPKRVESALADLAAVLAPTPMARS